MSKKVDLFKVLYWPKNISLGFINLAECLFATPAKKLNVIIIKDQKISRNWICHHPKYGIYYRTFPSIKTNLVLIEIPT